jgi:hypothetical protein
MKSTKKLSVPRIKWIILLLAILATVLLTCYASLRTRVVSVRDTDSPAGISPEGDDTNPEYLEKRLQFLDWFFGRGPEGVSPTAYASALAAARTLPPSPLLQDRKFIPAQPAVLSWNFPVPPPIANSWGGGASARTDAIAVNPANADIVYTGSEGGLAKSIDGGEHWSYLSDGLSSQSFRSIAIDPIAPNIIYAGTGTNEHFGIGIYRSTDSGATWKLFGSKSSEFGGSTVVKIAIDPRTAGFLTSTTVYASVTRSGSPTGTHSVWKSTNSGSNWSQIKPPATGAASGDSGFYDIAIRPGGGLLPSTVYITAPDGVFSGTGNGTWTHIHDVYVPSAHSCLALAQSALYLAFIDSDGLTSVAESTDSGSTWPPLPRPPDQVGAGGLLSFGVDPAHPNRLFVGGWGALRYSLNSGAPWLFSQGVHEDDRSIAFCQSNTDRNYLGTDAGIYRADYTGGNRMTWSSKNQNLAGCLMYGISLSRDGHMVMGNQDNGTQVGWAGRNPPWQMTSPGTGDGYKPRVDQNDSNRFYYTKYLSFFRGAEPGAPYRTVSGVTTSVTPPAAVGECSAFFPAMFAAPADWTRVIVGFRNVWRSTNSGDTWTRIGGTPCPGPTPNPCSVACGMEPGPTPGTLMGVYEAPSNTDVIYAFIDAGRAYVTSNANQGNGAQWTPRMSGLPSKIHSITVDPTDYQTAYFAGDHGVYKTANMGATYTQVAIADLGYYDVAIDPANPQHVFAASLFGVLSSTDGGTTWANMSAGIPAGMLVTSLSLNATSRQLAASTYGRGVYVADLAAGGPQPP